MSKLSRLIENLESDPDIIAARTARKSKVAKPDPKLSSLKARVRRIVKCAVLKYQHEQGGSD